MVNSLEVDAHFKCVMVNQKHNHRKCMGMRCVDTSADRVAICPENPRQSRFGGDSVHVLASMTEGPALILRKRIMAALPVEESHKKLPDKTSEVRV